MALLIDERAMWKGRDYRCRSCGWTPSDRDASGEWNHCPNCLSGMHEIDEEGFACGGTLQPVGIWVKADDCWEIVQRCSLCGGLTTVPMNEDDNPVMLLSLASRPLSISPFPLERMEEITMLMGGQGDVGGYYDEQGK